MIEKVDDNPMKDNAGRYRTYSLFIEHPQRGFEAYWTLANHDRTVDGKLYPSLKRIYLSYDHIPKFEYDFAMDYFQGWTHWDKMATTSGLKLSIAVWREELDVKLKAEAIKTLVLQAKGSTPAATQAAKWIAEHGYDKKRGRPSNAEIEQTKRIEAGVETELEADRRRMELVK